MRGETFRETFSEEAHKLYFIWGKHSITLWVLFFNFFSFTKILGTVMDRWILSIHEKGYSFNITHTSLFLQLTIIATIQEPTKIPVERRTSMQISGKVCKITILIPTQTWRLIISNIVFVSFSSISSSYTATSTGRSVWPGDVVFILVSIIGRG